MFYCFSQNNSGGWFDFDPDRGISEYVIVEAQSADHANQRAEAAGLYFDGCSAGNDCDCCGDRWSLACESEGTESPLAYGEPVVESTEDIADTYVHFLDGRVVQFRYPDRFLLHEKMFSIAVFKAEKDAQ